MKSAWDLINLQEDRQPRFAKPIAPAEVFNVPAECWKCRNRYQCATCPHGLKEPLVIGQRYGKEKAF